MESELTGPVSALIAAIFSYDVLSGTVLTTNLGTWYTGSSLWIAAGLLGLAFHGYCAAVRGGPARAA